MSTSGRKFLVGTALSVRRQLLSILLSRSFWIPAYLVGETSDKGIGEDV